MTLQAPAETDQTWYAGRCDSMIWSSNSNFVRVAAAIVILGCGSPATRPLDIYPGLSREQAIAGLRARDYCRGQLPVRKIETYPQCGRPGARYAHSWVTVEYDKDVLRLLQRFERHDDQRRAATRWNDLVAARTEIQGPPSQMARERLLEIRSLPAGAVSWAAWFGPDSRILIGIYLLRASGPDDPHILEEILTVAPSP